MKKLMVAVAIVCAAVMAQASCAITWNSNGKQYVDSTGTILTSTEGLVLVVMSSATGWDSATAITTGSGLGATTMTVSSGRVSGQVQWTWSSGGDNLIDNGDYLALMYSGKNGLEQLKYYQADGKGATVDAVYSVGSGVITGNNYSKTGAKIAMTGSFTAPVPEPTSGLLLVLGMAGLALRRRRA